MSDSDIMELHPSVISNLCIWEINILVLFNDLDSLVSIPLVRSLFNVNSN